MFRVCSGALVESLMVEGSELGLVRGCLTIMNGSL